MSYAGAKTAIVLASCLLFSLSLAAILSGIAPPFTEDTSRALNVVHIVDTRGKSNEDQETSSYVSLYSLNPGNLTKEAEQIGEGFICGREKVVDFVTFSATYSCWTDDNVETGWNKLDIPTLDVASDVKEDDRVTKVLIDTKISTRWAIKINTQEITDFTIKEDSKELVPVGGKSSKDGWHIIQFSGGKNAPRKFELTLYWVKNYTDSGSSNDVEKEQVLLRLRKDVDS